MVDQWLQSALALHKAGELKKAEMLYHSILAIDPNHYDALHLLGVVAHQQGLSAKAVELIGKAISLNRKDATAHNNFGEALRVLGRLEDAIAAYRKALRLQPNYADALNNYGTALREKNDYEGAMANFRQALAVKPDHAGAHNNLGLALRQAGRMDEAIEHFRQAIKHSPRLAEAHFNLGHALSAKGRHAEALACFGAAVEHGHKFQHAHLVLGQKLLDLGRYADAAKALRRAIELAPDSLDAHLGLGLALASMGRQEEACEESRLIADFREQPSFPHYGFGVLLAKCGRQSEARREFEECLTRDPGDSQGAELALACLGCAPPPRQAPNAMLVKIYGDRSASWNRAANEVGGYAAPRLIEEALARLRPGRGDLSILDAGCGTGLVGQLIHGYASNLEGVDLSQAMLEHAMQWGCYQTLHCREITDFLGSCLTRFDVIVSAATLIHFGDLAPVFRAAAHTLNQDGLFVFTLFPHNTFGLDESKDPDFVVGSFDGFVQGGCFFHNRRYVARLAEASGFAVEILEDRVHEIRNEVPTNGLLVALRLTSA